MKGSWAARRKRRAREKAFMHWDGEVARAYRAMQAARDSGDDSLADAYSRMVDQYVAIRTLYITRDTQPRNGAWGVAELGTAPVERRH